MIRHRYGDRYLHNGALEIGFRGLELSEDLLLIGHFIFESSAKVSLLTTPYLWNKWPLKLSQCLPRAEAVEPKATEQVRERRKRMLLSKKPTYLMVNYKKKIKQ
ncbi:hypothetical protein T10_640 [Trichinella papuae]|uniref:Uncharacterized protein n=1 Tax=Trichinella papuae TaxID=268474 RepID=A0A0V1MVZ0_9BILA|nr:hypothetical protein T10_640 [Trichinella papuae]